MGPWICAKKVWPGSKKPAMQHISVDSIAKFNCFCVGRSSGFRTHVLIQTSFPGGPSERYFEHTSGYSSASAMDLHHLPVDQTQNYFFTKLHFFPPV